MSLCSNCFIESLLKTAAVVLCYFQTRPEWVGVSPITAPLASVWMVLKRFSFIMALASLRFWRRRFRFPLKKSTTCTAEPQHQTPSGGLILTCPPDGYLSAAPGQASRDPVDGDVQVVHLAVVVGSGQVVGAETAEEQSQEEVQQLQRGDTEAEDSHACVETRALFSRHCRKHFKQQLYSKLSESFSKLYMPTLTEMSSVKRVRKGQKEGLHLCWYWSAAAVFVISALLHVTQLHHPEHWSLIRWELKSSTIRSMKLIG